MAWYKDILSAVTGWQPWVAVVAGVIVYTWSVVLTRVLIGLAFVVVPPCPPLLLDSPPPLLLDSPYPSRRLGGHRGHGPGGVGEPCGTKVLRLACATLLLHVAQSQNTDSVPQYDFVIVGGGTAGLAVANRLSEMPDITVAVIETGDSVFNNHNVTQITGYGLSFGTAIDWAYETENH